MEKITPVHQNYQQLLTLISDTYIDGQVRAVRAVNNNLLQTYWEIGRHIVEFEQDGETKAIYGANLLGKLSKDLVLSHGKGFSLSNLARMRQFFLAYPIFATLSQKLSWSIMVEILKIIDPLERSFYEKQTVIENWSVREFQRQKQASLFLRLALSTDKEGVLKLSEEGRMIEKPEDIIRSPYVLDFLKMPEPYHFKEDELEKRIIDHLQHFLLELGKGFAFIGQQYRITLNNKHYYVDLVFYHRILKCFVIIDLKREEVGYEDIGQMNMYLGYFENEENTEGDNPPIGIVLAREKDEILVKYAMHGISSQLFVSKYQLYLPNREELRSELERLLYVANNEEI
jgi:predicted nuclease of restriction endonuclease-like (RecB) superfamily